MSASDRSKIKWHTVQFYDDEQFAIKCRCDSMAKHLRSGNAVLCFVSSASRESLMQQLTALGFNIDELQQRRQLQFYDAEKISLEFFKNHSFDASALKNYLGDIIVKSSQFFPDVQIYGEIVNVLCVAGDFESALVLEGIWNDIGAMYNISLHCTYILENFAHEKDSGIFDGLCQAHSHVVPTESFQSLNRPDEQQRFVAKLQQQSLALQTELKHRQEIENFLKRQEIELTKARDALEKAHREDHFHQIAEAMPQLVWTTGNDAKIEYCNNRWTKYTGMINIKGMEQSWISSAVDPHDVRRVQDAWDVAVDTRSVFAIEHRLIHCQDHQSRWYLTRAVPFFDEQGDLVRWFGTATDINEQKELEEKLLLAKNTAERANAAKTRFLASMSHDLRTPLNAIIGFSEILLVDPALKDVGTQQRENIECIAKSGRHLLNLVEGLLNLSAIESGKVELRKEMIDLKDILQDLSKTYELLTSKKGIKWYCDINVSHKIFADRNRLWGVLNNLVNNAIKFTPASGSIALVASENSNKAVINIKDTGVGIDSEDLERIFIPFEQGKQPGISSEGKGVGLGLSISRKMAELHGGSLSVQSTKGQGSCFSLTLPF